MSVVQTFEIPACWARPRPRGCVPTPLFPISGLLRRSRRSTVGRSRERSCRPGWHQGGPAARV